MMAKHHTEAASKSNNKAMQLLSLVFGLILTTSAFAADGDGDGVDDAIDNCPAVYNIDQLDLDGDGQGNECDDDIDGDSILNDVDNCEFAHNPGQDDADSDGTGDRCDADFITYEAPDVCAFTKAAKVGYSLDPTSQWADSLVWGTYAYVNGYYPLAAEHVYSDTAHLLDANGMRKLQSGPMFYNEWFTQYVGGIPATAQANNDFSITITTTFEMSNEQKYDGYLFNWASITDTKRKLVIRRDSTTGGIRVIAHDGLYLSDFTPLNLSAGQVFSGTMTLVKTGLQMMFYVNGSLVHTEDLAADMAVFPASDEGLVQTMGIGYSDGDITHPSEFSMTQARIYTRSLTADEITALGVNPYSGLVENGAVSPTYCDVDFDFVDDAIDNCPGVANTNQLDMDGDGIGNDCDLDDDNDGIEDATDNCYIKENPDQADADGDGLGDACDPFSVAGCEYEGAVNGPIEPDFSNPILSGLISMVMPSNYPYASEPDNYRRDLLQIYEIEGWSYINSNNYDSGWYTKDSGIWTGLGTTYGTYHNLYNSGQADDFTVFQRQTYKPNFAEPDPSILIAVSRSGQVSLTQSVVGPNTAITLTVDGSTHAPESVTVYNKIPYDINGVTEGVFALRYDEAANTYTGFYNGAEIISLTPSSGNYISGLMSSPYTYFYMPYRQSTYTVLQSGMFILARPASNTEIANLGTNWYSLTKARDANNNGISDSCEDADNDTVMDVFDNCPLVPNLNQADSDRDFEGDLCEDEDADGIIDNLDNCPTVPNIDQADANGDGIGDVCADFDDDGVFDDVDNCYDVPNPNQANADGDAFGNACDADDDNDTVLDDADNCPLHHNTNQADNDLDGFGDACDFDDDNDFIKDAVDNCPHTFNRNQNDNEGDGLGDACDTDDDNDGVLDTDDNCIQTPNADQLDTDGDGRGDACENDPTDVEWVEQGWVPPTTCEWGSMAFTVQDPDTTDPLNAGLRLVATAYKSSLDRWYLSGAYNSFTNYTRSGRIWEDNYYGFNDDYPYIFRNTYTTPDPLKFGDFGLPGEDFDTTFDWNGRIDGGKSTFTLFTVTDDWSPYTGSKPYADDTEWHFTLWYDHVTGFLRISWDDGAYNLDWMVKSIPADEVFTGNITVIQEYNDLLVYMNNSLVGLKRLPYPVEFPKGSQNNEFVLMDHMSGLAIKDTQNSVAKFRWWERALNRKLVNNAVPELEVERISTNVFEGTLGVDDYSVYCDADKDQVRDGDDNCPNVFNPSQSDYDQDSAGNACDGDYDGDGIGNGIDNCVKHVNPDQLDSDGDGMGDACDHMIAESCEAEGYGFAPPAVNVSSPLLKDVLTYLVPTAAGNGYADLSGYGAQMQAHSQSYFEGDSFGLRRLIDDAEFKNYLVLDGTYDRTPASLKTSDWTVMTRLHVHLDDTDRESMTAEYLLRLQGPKNYMNLTYEFDNNQPEFRVQFKGTNKTTGNSEYFYKYWYRSMNSMHQRMISGEEISFVFTARYTSSTGIVDFFVDGIKAGSITIGTGVDGGMFKSGLSTYIDLSEGQWYQDSGTYGNEGLIAFGRAAADAEILTLSNSWYELIKPIDYNGDGLSDACQDTDGDGINNLYDVCPDIHNPDQIDSDLNGIGDLCQDLDNDGILDINDNCPRTPNDDQQDIDGDGLGDVCDDDLDGDGVLNDIDNCPYLENPMQLDFDDDGIGSLCDEEEIIADAGVCDYGVATQGGWTHNFTAHNIHDDYQMFGYATKDGWKAWGAGGAYYIDGTSFDENGTAVFNNDTNIPITQMTTQRTWPVTGTDFLVEANVRFVQGQVEGRPVRYRNSLGAYVEIVSDFNSGDIRVVANDGTQTVDWLVYQTTHGTIMDGSFAVVQEGTTLKFYLFGQPTRSMELAQPLQIVEPTNATQYLEGAIVSSVPNDTWKLYSMHMYSDAKIDKFLQALHANPYFGLDRTAAYEDYCDTDFDYVSDDTDNCLYIPNADQKDTDADGFGDVCDDDLDNDGVINEEDSCVYIANATPVDVDGDGQDDACDSVILPQCHINGLVEERPKLSTKWNAVNDAMFVAYPTRSVADYYDELVRSEVATGETTFFVNKNDIGVRTSSPSSLYNMYGDFRVPNDYAGTDFTIAWKTKWDWADGYRDLLYVNNDFNTNNYYVLRAGTNTSANKDQVYLAPYGYTESGSNTVHYLTKGIYTDKISQGLNEGIFIVRQSGSNLDVFFNGELLYTHALPAPITAFTSKKRSTVRVMQQSMDDVQDVNGVIVLNRAVSNAEVNEMVTGTQWYELFQLTDNDNNSTPDICQDRDNDGVNDLVDNCVDIKNTTQTDSDGNGIGDACQDVDKDSVIDIQDNCPTEPNKDQKNLDGDEFGDVCDDDIDGDLHLNGADNCPIKYNPDQADFDNDGLGDECDTDWDGDTVENDVDNCPWEPNQNQSNIDDDTQGDACDTDMDNDGVDNDFDNCPEVENTNQADMDYDNIGDLCDPDADGDNIANLEDNCPYRANADQRDRDADGIGDVCDPDLDNDGILNENDNCVYDENPDQSNLDGDALGDVCDTDRDDDGVFNDADNCPDHHNALQVNTDGDGLGDTCDENDDNDQFPDNLDNCPLIQNDDQSDIDGDGMGDVCDNDDDNDTIEDDIDNCPSDPNLDQMDTDGDGQGDACDVDLDGDSIPNDSDNCVYTPNTDQLDTDLDGEGDQCDTDKDGDGVYNLVDNCELTPNADQLDTDLDEFGDACDTDDDNDNVEDAFDNCPLTPNTDQANLDGDGEGDACDSDIDGDGVLNGNDNCIYAINEDQADLDFDGEGDACDLDIDGDGVANAADNCLMEPNADQLNTDGDAQGDACDPDLDNDTILNEVDNCPTLQNTEQLDLDGDGIGDVCDEDRDNDGVINVDDNCIDVANDDQSDIDGDGMGDVCDTDQDGDGIENVNDNCIAHHNPDQRDADGDGEGDDCDIDADNDLILNDADNCWLVHNTDQLNTDGDSEGNACDSDDDNDGVEDFQDNCKLIPNEDQADVDEDNIGDVCDPDADNDGVANEVDNCEFVKNADQSDVDGDGLGDRCDPDADNDGIENDSDNCPLVPNEDQADIEGDGLGDVCDDDWDNDGITNNMDNCLLIPNNDQKNTDGDAEGDACDYDKDGDGIYNIVDNCPLKDNPLQEDEDGDGVGDVCDDVNDTDKDGIDNVLDNCPLNYNPKQEDLDGDGIGDNCDLDKDGDGHINNYDNCPADHNIDQLDTNGDGRGDVCQIDSDAPQSTILHGKIGIKSGATIESPYMLTAVIQDNLDNYPDVSITTWRQGVELTDVKWTNTEEAINSFTITEGDIQPLADNPITIRIKAEDYSGNEAIMEFTYSYGDMPERRITGRTAPRIPSISTPIRDKNNHGPLRFHVLDVKNARLADPTDVYVTLDASSDQALIIDGVTVAPGQTKLLYAAADLLVDNSVDPNVVPAVPGEVGLSKLTFTFGDGIHVPQYHGDIRTWSTNYSVANTTPDLSAVVENFKVTLSDDLGDCYLSTNEPDVRVSNPFLDQKCFVENNIDAAHWLGTSAGRKMYISGNIYDTGVATLTTTVKFYNPSTDSYILLDTVNTGFNVTPYQDATLTKVARDNMDVSQLVDYVTARLTTEGARCLLFVNHQRAYDTSLSRGYTDTPVCYIEWTEIPQGLVQNAVRDTPELNGYIANVGQIPISWNVKTWDRSGVEYLIESKTEYFNSAEAPNPVLTYTPLNDSGTVSSMGGLVGVIGTEGANGNTTIEVWNGANLVFSREYQRRTSAINLITRTRMTVPETPVYQNNTYTVKAYYTSVPSKSAQLDVQLMTVPDKVFSPQIVADKFYAMNLEPVTFDVQMAHNYNTAMAYDPTTMGTWNFRIVRWINSQTSEPVTDWVRQDSAGHAQFVLDISDLNASTYRYVAEAQLIDPGTGQPLGHDIKSRRFAYIRVLDGRPIEATISAARIHGPAPFRSYFALRPTERMMLAALGDVEWQVTPDGDFNNFIPTESEVELMSTRFVKTFNKGYYRVRAKTTNKYSGETFITEPVDMTSYFVNKIKLEASRSAFAGVTVPVNVKPYYDGGSDITTYKCMWRIGDKPYTAPIVGNTYNLVPDTPDFEGRIAVYARCADEDSPDYNVNPTAWASAGAYVQWGAVAAPYVTLKGPYRAEVGETYTWTAYAKLPYAGMDTTVPVTLSGQFVLPDGSTAQGPTVQYTVKDSDLNLDTGLMAVKYQAWIDGYENSGGFKEVTYNSRTWKYIWPTWTLNNKQPYTYVPSKAVLTATSSNTSVPLEGLQYSWDYPLTAGYTIDNDNYANSRSISISEPGTYNFSVTMTDDRGNTTTKTVAVEGIPAPPIQLDYRITKDNAYDRAPLSVVTYASAGGGHPADRYTDFIFRVNGQEVEDWGTSARTILEAGTHTVEIEVNSLLGYSATTSYDITVHPNQIPTCTMARSETSLSWTYSATCTDVDGNVQQYRWFVDGVDAQLSIRNLTVSKNGNDTEPTITLIAVDDSGAQSAPINN